MSSDRRSALELIREATGMLDGAQVDRSQWTAEQLLGARLGRHPVELYTEEPEVPAEEAVRFHADVAARAAGVPLQYLMGTADFYGREFLVGPGVFIPRPETEILVDVTLELLQAPSRQARGIRRVVDVGAGSGCIAVTLALERPDLEVVAVELSAHAIAFARRNAERLGGSIRLVQGSWMSGLKDGCSDLIVANPPYLDPGTVSRWPRELAWEPWVALDGGPGGSAQMEALMRAAVRVLRPGGGLVLEIGMDQAGRLREMAPGCGLSVEQIRTDLADLDRVAVLTRG